MENIKVPTLVIFASDQGAGDAERASIMSQTGNMLARQNVKLVCLAEKGVLPLPLLTSARAAGGDIELIADQGYVLPQNLQDLTIKVIADQQERYAYLAQIADCFVSLPGSLASITSQFFTIADLGAKIPMVFLNKNNAYEIVRGFSVDVFAHSFEQAHRNVQFVDSVEDIWGRVAKLVGV